MVLLRYFCTQTSAINETHSDACCCTITSSGPKNPENKVTTSIQFNKDHLNVTTVTGFSICTLVWVKETESQTDTTTICRPGILSAWWRLGCCSGKT